MSKYGSVKKRVARGASLLDRTNSGWEQMIDLGTLDMSWCTRCIFGQLYGRYSWGRDEHWDELEWEAANQQAVQHGFLAAATAATGADAEYKDLDAAWTALIKERFDSGLLSDAAGEGMEG